MSHPVTNKISKTERNLTSAIKDEMTISKRIEAMNTTAWRVKKIDTKRALLLSAKARRLAKAHSYPLGLAYSLRNISRCYYLTGNYKAGLKVSLNAIRLFEKLEDKQGLSNALNCLGNIYDALGQHSKSIESHSTSLQICEEIGDKVEASGAINNLGRTYFNLGDYAKALDYFQQSLELKGKFDVSTTLEPLCNIGAIHEKLEEYEKAVNCYLKAKKISRKTGDTEIESTCLVNLGMVYSLMGDYAKALDYLEGAAEVSHKNKNKYPKATASIYLGNLYQTISEYDKALDSYQQGLEIAQQIGHRLLESEAFIGLGDLFYKREDYEQAVEFLSKALNIAEEIGNNEYIFKAHHSLSQTHEQRGSFSQALYHHKSFYTFRQKVYGEEAEKELKKVMIRAEVEKVQKEAEIHRLKHVELAQANERLHLADKEKTGLLQQLQMQAVELKQQASEDGLTRLFNRRQLDLCLTQEFERARRSGRPLSIAIADIDCFKRINDEFTHQVGDEVLRTVAQLFKENCRKIDIVGRYGGEEFVILFCDTPLAKAARVCEKIRKLIEKYDWGKLVPDLKVTISMGLSDDVNASSHEALLSIADMNLYKAKCEGRNQICYDTSSISV